MGRERIHVVAGALVDPDGCVLMSRRAANAHQGGLWEFPGGKREQGESSRSALARELDEELGILPRTLSPLITVEHDYPDRAVRLEVWRVDRWSGTPRGREGQPIAWCSVAVLDALALPAADGPIVAALRRSLRQF